MTEKKDDLRERMAESLERALANAKIRRAALDAHRAAIVPGSVFTPHNIAHWVELAEAAQVPHIPILPLARIPVATLCGFEDPANANAVAAFHAEAAAGMAALGPRHMARWSHCAAEEIKYRMGRGQPDWDPDMALARVEDPRVYDLLHSYPEIEVAVYARPWVAGRIIDGFPEEYRVYVHDDRIRGISNYYLQRPIPNDMQTLKHLSVIYAQTSRLIAAQIKPINHGLVEGWPETNCWTVDFHVDARGRITLLEGGPPYGLGADPCCFGGLPDGIALIDQSGRFQRQDEMAAGTIHEPGTSGDETDGIGAPGTT